MKLKEKLLILIVILIAINSSCKKIDFGIKSTNLKNKDVNLKFYSAPSGTSELAKKVIFKMKEQNIDNEFLATFLKNNGTPKWDKIIVQKKAKQTSNIAVSNSTADFDTIIIVPFVKVNEYSVNGFLKIKITDSIRYNYSLAQDYKNYPYNINQEGLSAESFATLIMALNNKVFGYKRFLIKDSLLFRNNNINSSQDVTVTLEDSLTPNLQQNLNTISECTGTTIYVSWSCNSTFNQNIIDPNHCGVSFQFNNCLVTGVDWTGIWGGGVPNGSGSSGGGSGGGGFIPYNFPCNPTIINTNNINEPPGGPGVPLPPCPLPTTGIGWVPANPNGVQNVNNYVTNSCLNEVYSKVSINGFKSKLGIFLQTFAGNPNITININQTDTLESDVMGQTTFDTTTNNYNITLNGNELPHCSQEMIANTYFHEIIHVYLKTYLDSYDFVNNSQHTAMLSTYFTDLINATMTTFPNINHLTAFSLAWDGIANAGTDSPQDEIVRDIFRGKLLQKIHQLYPGTDESVLLNISAQHQNGGTAGTRSPNCN